MRLGLDSSAGSLDEIEVIYRSRLEAFQRVAAAVSSHAELGADAVHDAFVLAVRHRRRFRGEGPLEAWIWRIVVNEARKRRAEGARLVPTDPASLESPAASNGSGPVHRARALVAALPERQRLVLILRYYADLDYGSIAHAVGIRPGTVGATLNSAHTTLRKSLQEVER